MSSYQRHRRRKSRGKKSQRGANPQPTSECCDFHHFLFQKRHWNQGYAKALRNHPYAGAKIPMRTLHREIHSKIHDVPRPNGDVCKRTYQKLVALCKSGELDPHDPPEKKLQFFIDEWADECPATVAILRWQQQIIRKFRKRKGGGKMNNEMRWTFEADMLYETETDRNEAYSLLASNGVYPMQMGGEGLRLRVAVPSVNAIIFMRLSEILTRFPAIESSLSLAKVD